MTRPTNVYFIATADRSMVKIGCSETPLDRLTNLAGWSPVPLDVLAFVPGSFNDERALHGHYIDLHSHREWFRSSPEMLADIAAITRFGELPSRFHGDKNTPNLIAKKGIRGSAEWIAKRSAAQKASWARRKRINKIEPRVAAYMAKASVSAKQMNQLLGQILISGVGCVHWRSTPAQLDAIETFLAAAAPEQARAS